MCYGDYKGIKELNIFLRYVCARVKEKYREETYRIFISESLRLLPQGKILKNSYLDMFDKKQVETRSGKEVAEEVAQKIGIHIDWGGESE